MDFDETADDLFALTPAQFVPARDAAAREAKAAGEADLAKRIAALRKPTAVAWLANRLAAECPDELADFIELGAGFREATAALEGDALRDLSRQRARLVTALVSRAKAVAEAQPGDDVPAVNASVLRSLEETLYAALADPDSGDALLAGRLSGGLEPQGFTDVPPRADAARTASAAPARRTKAAPSAPAEPAATAKDPAKQETTRSAAARAKRRAVETELGHAWSRAREAADSRDSAEQAATEARTAYDEVAREVTAARRALDDATERRTSADTARTAATAEAKAARKTADEARREVARLQSALDKLSG